MEKNTKEKKEDKPKSKRGGPRAGSGRPKGSVSHITIEGLLQTVRDKSNGGNYEEILIDDFLKARLAGDTHLTLKYHNLILNKVMNNLAKIEITEPQDAIEAKQQIFADALAKLTGIKKD
jgi:hypothetical protein